MRLEYIGTKDMPVPPVSRVRMGRRRKVSLSARPEDDKWVGRHTWAEQMLRGQAANTEGAQTRRGVGGERGEFWGMGSVLACFLCCRVQGQSLRSVRSRDNENNDERVEEKKRGL